MKKLLNKTNLLIVGVLILASFLRLYRVSDYMTFLGDEGRDMLVVYNILHGKFTLLGPTASVGGFFMGPFYYYLITPFLWLFKYDPIGPSIMVGLLGTITVYLIYKLGYDFFGEKQGLIASFFYAISPLVVAYSRSSWNPNVMPFFTILTMYTLYKALTKKNTLLFFLTGVIFGIDIQLHYIELFLGVAMVLYILWYRYSEHQKQSFIKTIATAAKDYIYTFLGFLVGFSPFLAFEVRHGFPNIKSVLNFILYSGDTGGNSNFIDTISNVFFRLFGRLITKFPSPEQYIWYPNFQLSIWTIVTVLLGLVSFFVLIRQFITIYKKDTIMFNKISLLIIWFAIGVFLFGFYKKQIHDYYFEFLFPLPFLFVGNLFVFLWRKNVFIKICTALLFVWITYINLLGIPFRFPPNKQLAQTKEIAKFVLEKTEGKSFNFALITGGNSDHAYRYFFKLAGRDPVVIEYPGIDPQRKTVADQLLVICEKIPCEPVGHGLWEIAGFGRAEIKDKSHVSVVDVYKLVHYK